MAAFPELLDARAAVTLRAVLLALGTLLLWLGALMLAALVTAVVAAILWPLNKFVSTVTFGAVGSVPGSHAVEQFFTNRLGDAAAGVDKAAGSFWHSLKTLVTGVAAEIFGLAVLLGYLVWYATVKYPLRLIHTVAHQAVRIAKNVERQIRHAERSAAHALRYAQVHIRHLGARVGVVEHAIDVTLPHEIKTARDLAKDAETTAANAWDWIKQNGGKLTASGFAAATLAALSTLGLGWLKCESNPFNGNRKACTMWGDFADLLGLALALDAALNFEQLVHQAQDVAEVTTTGIQDVFGLNG